MKHSKDILTVLFIISVVVFSSLPLFKNINNINLDWDFLQDLSLAKFRKLSHSEYHQYPLRTPYFNGGYPLIASNDRRIIVVPNPLFSIIGRFGVIISIKIQIFLAFLMGALGMYYLTRCILKYNRLGALFSSLTFYLSGCLYKVLMLRGNLFLADYLYLPFLLAFFIKSKEDKKYILFTAFVLIYVLRGDLKLAAISLFLFSFACLQFKWIYLRNSLMVFLFTFLLGARTFIPKLELLRESRYSVNFYKLFGEPLLTNSALLERMRGIYNLLLTHQSSPSDIAIKGYFPLEFYLGYIPVSLFIFACLFYWRKQLKWTVFFVIFTLLSFGTNTQLDLFRLLHRLPIFNAMYKPAKYFVPIVAFIITLGAGRSFLILERFKKRKLLTLFSLSLLIITVLDLYWTNRPRQDIYPEKIPQYKRQESFFQVKNLTPNYNVGKVELTKIPTQHAWELTRPTPYELLLENIGKINAYTNIHLGEYATPKYYIEWNGVDSFDPANYVWHPNPDYKGEIYFLNHSNNKAEFQYFSPNKLIAKVSVYHPDTLIINQNYDKYWKSDLAKPTSHNGLLAVNLNKRGEYLVKFNYVPVSFYFGIGVSLISLVLITYYIL